MHKYIGIMVICVFILYEQVIESVLLNVLNPFVKQGKTVAMSKNLICSLQGMFSAVLRASFHALVWKVANPLRQVEV